MQINCRVNRCFCRRRASLRGSRTKNGVLSARYARAPCVVRCRVPFGVWRVESYSHSHTHVSCALYCISFAARPRRRQAQSKLCCAWSIVIEYGMVDVIDTETCCRVEFLGVYRVSCAIVSVWHCWPCSCSTENFALNQYLTLRLIYVCRCDFDQIVIIPLCHQ